MVPGWPRTSQLLSGGLHAHVEVQRQVGMAVIQNRLLTPVQRQSTQLPRYLERNTKQKREEERKREAHVSLLNQPKSLGFNILSALRIFGIGLIYFMQSCHSAVINAALAGDTVRAPRPEICGAQTPTFSWSDLYAR